MYGWGYTKADIQRIENEDADKRDEARYMADDNDDNGDDAGDEE